MKTKAYTDLEQSNILRKYLPIESADMHYNNGSCRGVDYTEHFSAELMPYQEALHLMKIHKTNFMFQVIPCWSLTALLNVLPSSTLDSSDDHRYRLHCMERFTEWYDNAIDACYEAVVSFLYKRV